MFALRLLSGCSKVAFRFARRLLLGLLDGCSVCLVVALLVALCTEVGPKLL